PTWAAGATLWVAGDRCFIRTGRGRRRYPCSEGAAGDSPVHPLTGGGSFDVPVPSWGDRGTEIPFSLPYPPRRALDPDTPFLQPKHPAALSDASSADNYNPRWTHSFAQWVEVLNDGSAIWHHGDGTEAEFEQYWVGTSGPFWRSEESYLSLTSSGTA